METFLGRKMKVYDKEQFSVEVIDYHNQSGLTIMESILAMIEHNKIKYNLMIDENDMTDLLSDELIGRLMVEQIKMKNLKPDVPYKKKIVKK